MLLPDVPNYWLHYYLLALVGAPRPMPGPRGFRGGLTPDSLHVRQHVGAVSFQAVVLCSAGYARRRDCERPIVLCAPL